MAYNQYVARVGFPHSAIGSFYGALTKYFKEYVYPFSNVVFGSFNKAIKYIDDLKNEEENVTMGMLVPFVTLTSTLGDPVKETAFLWKYGNSHPYQVNWFQDPIVLQDGHAVNIITNRFAGNVEFNVFAESQMEIHDIMLHLNDSFRGLNKWTGFENFESFFIMNKNIILATIDGNQIFDWNDTSLKSEFLPGINSTKYYYPTHSNPQMMLNSVTDSSSFYGGSGLPEYSLQGSISFEIEIPTLITLSTFIDVKSISSGIGVENYVQDSETANTKSDYIVIDDQLYKAKVINEIAHGSGNINYPLKVDAEEFEEGDVVMFGPDVIEDYTVEDGVVSINDLGINSSDIGFSIRVLKPKLASCVCDGCSVIS